MSGGVRDRDNDAARGTAANLRDLEPHWARLLSREHLEDEVEELDSEDAARLVAETQRRRERERG